MIEKINNQNRLLILIVALIALIITTYYAIRINPNLVPDEVFRSKISYFLLNNNALPLGNESSIIDKNWGNSYAFVPYLVSIIAYVFMKIGTLVNLNYYFSIRIVSILSVFGTILISGLIGKELFKKESTALLFAVLVGFLPQFIFLGCYFNNDAFSVFVSALIIFCWIYGIKNNWSYKICALLGISLGIMALTYYNTYGFILMSLPLFIISFYYQNKGDWEGLIKRALFIFLITFVISGWFFIRNYFIHNGDFLGLKTGDSFSEQFALQQFKPSMRETPANLNESFTQAFLYPKGDYSWVEQTALSFVGVFGYLKIFMIKYIYMFYAAIIGIGLLSTIIFRNKSFKNISLKESRTIFIISLICTMIIPIILSMYYSYYTDYQAQGRYIMSMLIPLMIFVSFGYENLISKISEKLNLKNIDLTYFIVIIYILMLLVVVHRYFLHMYL